MKESQLKELSTEELSKKESETKILIWIFVPIILGLLYFAIQNYLRGEELDMALITIIICSIGGPASLWPQLKAIREELKNRGEG
jgi:hypothetical protein